MAACGSLQHIFDTPLQESPSNLLQSFTQWNHLQPLEVSSLTEFFGELHFKENTEHVSPPLPPSNPTSSFFSIDFNAQHGSENLNDEKNEKHYTPRTQRKHYNSDSFSSMNSESLSICTEGLGFESCDDTEDFENSTSRKHQESKTNIMRHFSIEHLSGKRSRITGGELPPPISCIGKTGKPWVCFKSYRQDGRFVLKEVKIPTQEYLHARREDGRLKLQYIQSDDDIIEEDEEKEDKGDDAQIRTLVSNFGEEVKGI